MDVLSPAPKETNNGASERTLEKEEKQKCRVIAKEHGVRNTRKVLFQGEYRVQPYNRIFIIIILCPSIPFQRCDLETRVPAGYLKGT